LDGPLAKWCPAIVLSRQDGRHSAVVLLLKAVKAVYTPNDNKAVYTPNDNKAVYTPNDKKAVYTSNDNKAVYTPNDKSIFQ
jgi:hypothetical protein